jgi:hypothetical protein
MCYMDECQGVPRGLVWLLAIEYLITFWWAYHAVSLFHTRARLAR